MLEHPPAFFEPVRAVLANVSGWLDWNALEAIGTVGALWFAVVQSSRSARAERARQIGTLTHLVGLVEPVTEAVPIFDEGPGGLGADDIEYLIDQHDTVQRAIDGLSRIPLADVAAVGATEFAGALPLVLGYIKDGLPTKHTDKVAAGHLNGWASYVSEANDSFREQRDYIRHGWLGSRLRARIRRLDIALWEWRYRRNRQAKRGARLADRPDNQGGAAPSPAPGKSPAERGKTARRRRAGPPRKPGGRVHP